jgi:hypothetical protein
VQKASSGKRNVLKLVFACSALLMFFAADASAQESQRPKQMVGLTWGLCRDGQLSVRNVGEDAAMGGVRVRDYAFTNTSSRPCTLKDYPRFEVLNAAGRVVRLGRAVAGDDDGSQHDFVTVAPGKTATFQVNYNAGGAGRIGKPCPTYPKVRITAPGTKRGFVLRDAIQLCGGVGVSPVGPPTAEQP